MSVVLYFLLVIALTLAKIENGDFDSTSMYISMIPLFLAIIADEIKKLKDKE